MKYYYNQKKISRKKAVEIFGKDKMKKRHEEAMESYMEDPLTLIEWMDGLEIKVAD